MTVDECIEALKMTGRDNPAEVVIALRDENKRLREALTAIVDFDQTPMQSKQPDFFGRLLARAHAVLGGTNGT